MYYGIILLTVIMFGGCFALNDIYRKQRGNSLKITLELTFISSLASFIVLLFINKFQLGYTHFTLIVAFVTSILSILCTFCGFKALGTINLSLYSLFMMLGGMVIPFIQGIVFYNEGITVAKSLCFIIICIALFFTVEKGEKKTGSIYYIGIFMLNGLIAASSKYFASSNYEKTNAASYTMLTSLCSLVFSFIFLAFVFRKQKTAPNTFKSICIAASNGITNKIANFLLVIALAHVDASVQYPMVTGGVMIVSTLICFFTPNKPKRKEIISVLIAFIGMLSLTLPI